MTNNEIETEIFRNFIKPDSAERFEFFVNSSKRRNKIFHNLRDERYFKNKCLHEVTGAEKEPDTIYKLLKKDKISDQIYVISIDSNIDRKVLSTMDVLNIVVGQGIDTIGYCLTSKKGFFVNHEDSFWILTK